MLTTRASAGLLHATISPSPPLSHTPTTLSSLPFLSHKLRYRTLSFSLSRSVHLRYFSPTRDFLNLNSPRAVDEATVDAIAVEGVGKDVWKAHGSHHKTKWTTEISPELLDIIGFLRQGEDVETALAPWTGTWTQAEWSKVVASVGDSDWKLALKVFDLLRTKSTFAVHTLSSNHEDGETKRVSLLKACTTLVAVLAKHGRESEIEALVVEMKFSGLNPDAYFFNAVVRNYGINGHIHLASRVLFQMERHEIQPNNTTYERVIAAYLSGEKPQITKALQLLRGLRTSKVTVGYRTLSDLLLVCSAANRVEDADEIFGDMQAAGYHIDYKDWAKVIQLHGRKGNYEMVEGLIQKMRVAGLEAKAGVYDALLLSYCRARLADQALSVFREYKLKMRPSLVAYNMLIDASGKAGRHEEAMQLYVEVRESGWSPNTVTYTSLISAVAQGGRYEKAEELYQRMLDEGLTPSSHTFATMIHTYALRGWTKVGHEVCLSAMRSAKDGVVNKAVYGSMLNLYIKGRWYSHAADVLREMESKEVEPDFSGYGILLSSCGEPNDSAFAPLAKAMECSQYEPCRVAFRLACVPLAREDTTPAGNEPLHDHPEHIAESQESERDIAVEQASAFLEYYASTHTRDSNLSLYNALLDALWKQKLRRRAKLVMLKLRNLLEWYNRPNYGEMVWTLDLRGLSKGASEVALLHWLSEVAKRAETCPIAATKLVLITGGRETESSDIKPFSGRGKGNGSVIQVAKDIIKDFGVPFTEVSDESSPARFQAQPEQVIRWVRIHKDLLQLEDETPL